MKNIKLSRGEFAIVDNFDFKTLSNYRWSATSACRKNGTYAFRNMKLDVNKWDNILMHRQILGLNKGDKFDVDHKNGNGLDNRRRNIRICTRIQNSVNQKPLKYKKYKGVSFHKKSELWRAYICPNKKMISLGYFKTEEEGALAYNKKAKELFGEFARLNQIKKIKASA